MKRGKRETQKQREVRRKSGTLPKYRPEAVRRIREAIEGPNDPEAPSDPVKFLEWLHSK